MVSLVKGRGKYVGGLEGALEDGYGVVLRGDFIERFGAAGRDESGIN